jgi:hypothetical protein
VLLPNQLNYLRPLVVDDLRRLGRDHDGGYVLPESVIALSEHLVSFGLSWDWSFEKDFKARNSRIRIDAYDHTIYPRGIIRWAAKAVLNAALLRQSPRDAARTLRDAADYCTIMRHFVQRVSVVKARKNDVTIPEVFGRVPAGRRIFLKMDIEGSEYDVLPDILAHSQDIICMVIEFHDLSRTRETFESSVRSILRDFEVVHIHGNNWGDVADDGLPDVLEMTFLSRTHCPDSAPRREALPLGIDQPNHPDRPDIPMLFPAAVG